MPETLPESHAIAKTYQALYGMPPQGILSTTGMDWLIASRAVATNSIVRVRLLSPGITCRRGFFQPPVCTAPWTWIVTRPLFWVATTLSIL